MRSVLRWLRASRSGQAALALAIACLGACAETAPPTPLTPRVAADDPLLDFTADWIISDLSAEYGTAFSFDTTEAGMNAEVRYDTYTVESDEREFCRDHFKPIDLWWDGGYGIATIHLDPPLLFRGYRPGTWKDRRGLVWRRAIYETVQAGEGQDPAGNVWRFQGRFNANCRGGSREIGPIVFYGQIVVSQDPIDRPVLVRRGSGTGGGCEEDMYDDGYNYYEADPRWLVQPCGDDSGEDGTQYQPGDNTGGETVDWGTGTGNGGSSACGAKAVVEYICIDIWVDGEGWVEWGCGFVTTC